MTTVIILCAKDGSGLALELGLVYSMMQIPTHLHGLSERDSDTPQLAFFQELGGQVHHADLCALLTLHPNAQVIRV